MEGSWIALMVVACIMFYGFMSGITFGVARRMGYSTDMASWWAVFWPVFLPAMAGVGLARWTRGKPESHKPETF